VGGAVTATSAAGTDELVAVAAGTGELIAAAAGTGDLTGAVTVFARPATARDWRGVAPRTVLSEAALPEVVPAGGVPSEGVPSGGVPSEVLLCDEPASAPTSATATAGPPTIPAPSPSVTAAVPSQA
jgi:hypothetical protein